MPLEDFAVPTDWIVDLDQRWPERVALKTFIVDKLCEHIAAASDSPRILELGIGDGDLMLQLYDQFPAAEFVAVDIKPVLLDFVGERFDRSARVTFVEQDLSADQWTAVGNGFDVIYSLQSFHDLGGEEALSNSYQRCLDRLAPNGMMLNTDFVEPMPQDDPQRPRRFAPDVHIRMLTSLGFREAKMLKRVGQLACLSARAEA